MAFLAVDGDIVCFPSNDGESLYLDLEVSLSDDNDNKCDGCFSRSINTQKAFIYHEDDDKTIYNIAVCNLCEMCNDTMKDVSFIDTTDVIDNLPKIIKNKNTKSNSSVIELNGYNIDTNILHQNDFTIGRYINTVNLFETSPKCYQLVLRD